MIIYEILDVVSSYLVIGYSLKEYDSSSYMKVSDQAQGHRSRKRWKSLFRQCKTFHWQ